MNIEYKNIKQQLRLFLNENRAQVFFLLSINKIKTNQFQLEVHDHSLFLNM